MSSTGFRSKILATSIFTLLFFGWLPPATVFAQQHSHAGGRHDGHEPASELYQVGGRGEGQDAHVHGSPSDFNPSQIIIEHVLDAHEWHITDLPDGTPIALHLPWMLYSPEKGFEAFLLHGHGHDAQARELANKGYVIDEATNQVKTLGGGFVLDLSITKAVLHMLLIALLVVLVFISVAKAYQKRQNQAPKGLQSLLEPIILYIRNDIAVPNLHGKHDKYLPYLLSVFFFIWFSNLLGLTPLSSNIMGNISVTAGLAFFTFLFTNLSGTKAYWGHVFWFPGVPLGVKFIMLPVELLGLFIRPAALMIRLFANIAAGHFMVTSLIMMIFIIGKMGAGAGWGTAVGSVFFTGFIMLLEFLVAILQAYVFTVLSAVFIGQALETHHHAEDHHSQAHKGHANA